MKRSHATCEARRERDGEQPSRAARPRPIPLAGLFSLLLAGIVAHVSPVFAQTAVVDALSPSAALCPSRSTVLVPVTLTRASGPLVKGVSVSIQLSPELVAPAGPASIAESDFMSAGGATTFHVVDLGAGAYVVDVAVLSPSCGSPVLGDTLFTVTVAAAAPVTGVGTLAVTNTIVRDCLNADLPSAAGATANVTLDFSGPAVTVLSPNGGESWFYGQSVPISWTATDPLGVPTVDLYLSRSGAGGPWTPIALAAPNTGAYAWTATGPGVIGNAFVRVVASDACGSAGEDAGNAGFSILDPATPTLIAMFRVQDAADGVRIDWQPGSEQTFGSLAPERAAAPDAAWARVPGTPSIANGVRTLLDREPAPGERAWYRLSGTLRDGSPMTFAPVSVRRGEQAVLALAPITPNPARERARVSFEVPRAADVRLTVHDAQGREVGRLAGGRFEPGRYVAELGTNDLAAGVYFVRLVAAGTKQQRSLIVVR